MLLCQVQVTGILPCAPETLEVENCSVAPMGTVVSTPWHVLICSSETRREAITDTVFA